MDGVIVGADSAATLGALGQNTVWQPTDQKVAVVDGRALIACAGPVGLGQRVKGEFAKAINDSRKLRGESWEVMAELRKLFQPHLKEEYEAAVSALPIAGNAARISALGQTLVAMPAKGVPTLFQFDQNGAPEEATVSLPFICLGSGQSLADPFMAFIRSIFWEESSLPTIPEATFATLWAIQQSVSVAPGGLAEPIHIYVLEGDGQRYKARELEQSELDEHRQAIAQAREALAHFRDLQGGTAVDVPQPPE